MHRHFTAFVLVAFTFVGCIRRTGDEIMVDGKRHRTFAPVVLWSDPGGYNAYQSSQPHFNARPAGRLKDTVDQIVIHYDACGLSRECFRVLHDDRNLSTHFMIDIDGTIYQTLDLKERAWHATTSNDRSIGIEIANIGAYEARNDPALIKWYERDINGRLRITIPENLGDGGVKTPGFVGRPATNQLVRGTVQGKDLYQYDLTPQQYESLAKLTATLCKVFPNIKVRHPESDRKLPDVVLTGYQGIIGHYHIQENKVDPGPAFQWDKYVQDVQRRMK